MDQATAILVVAAAVVLVLAVGLWYAYEQRRRRKLREHFGTEYEHVVSEKGDPREAERVLSEREARVKKLDIHPLAPAGREQFVARWRKVQERFVDDPRAAVTDADAVIGEAMVACGYPVGDFEQRAADVSVDHPGVVTDYRTAHEIAGRRSDVSTEDLRRAMVHYRSLFEELVAPPRARTEERVEEREETVR
jgi:hypothetical protein